MKQKILIVLVLCSVALQMRAQNKSDVAKITSQLTITEKIDLLCAKYPGVEIGRASCRERV